MEWVRQLGWMEIPNWLECHNPFMVPVTTNEIPTSSWPWLSPVRRFMAGYPKLTGLKQKSSSLLFGHKNCGYINFMKSQWNPSFWCSKILQSFTISPLRQKLAGPCQMPSRRLASVAGPCVTCSYEGDPFFQKWICWYQMVVFFMGVWKWGIKKKHVSEDNDDHLLEWGVPLFSDKPMFIHTLRETGRSGSGEKNI